MLLSVSVAVPLLVNVTSFAALVFPTVWLPKLRLAVDRVNFRGGVPSLDVLAAKIAVARMIAGPKNRTAGSDPGVSMLAPPRRGR
jgi:hypothetical protein